MYVLIVKKLNDEYEDRKDIGRIRKWFTLEEANHKLSEHKPVQQLYLQKLIRDQVKIKFCLYLLLVYNIVCFCLVPSAKSSTLSQPLSALQYHFRLPAYNHTGNRPRG